MEYGVNVTNKFAFLDDEGDDPTALIARVKQRKEKERLAKKEAKKEVAPAPPAKQVGKDNKENIESRQLGTRQNHQNRGSGNRGPRVQKDVMAERFGERRKDGPKPRAPPRRRDDDGIQQDKPRFVRSQDNNEHAVDESADGGRQKRFPRRDQFRGPPRPRPDRFSGSDKTGVRSVPKKDGHGKGNWGDNNDEVVGEVETVNAPDEANKTEAAADTGATGNEPEKAQEEEEKEPPKLTLEEWRAQLKQDKPVFKTRKANEGADQKSLQKFVPLKKNEEEDSIGNVEGVTIQTKRQQREKTLNIEVNFTDPNRREFRQRGDYGNRGPRGAQNRGLRRDHRGPAIDFAHDFPALGTAH